MVVSPNVDFDESSVSAPLMKSMETLSGLKDAFGTEEHVKSTTHVEEATNEVSGNASEWESDEEIL